jgi:DeoR/GlpR family transcriptional regulator of sugar metabolism
VADDIPGSRNVLHRRRLLLDYVIKSGSAQVDDLAARFAVSRMTVHRDLDALAEQGMVRKVHGGVTTRASSLVENNFLLRSRLAEPEKRALGRAAAALVEPGQSVILDDSTTAAAVAPYLAAYQPLTVITNGLAVIERLRATPGIGVICLGGNYNPRFNAFFGLLCEQAIAALRANILFMSSSSVLGNAAYHQEQDVVKTKRALMAIAERRILLLDSRKFGLSALYHLADLSEFDLVLTDRAVTPAVAQSIRDAKVGLQIVGDADFETERGETIDEPRV